MKQRLRLASTVGRALVGGLLLVACGGESTTDFVAPEGAGETGTGGTSGGAGGSSGETAQATTNSTSAGTTAATSAGTTEGAGGSSSTTGTTASSAGGASTTTSGTTTGGIMNPTPDPELVQACASTCELEVAAACPSGPSATSCASACRVITRVEACADELAEFFSCVETDDTTSCSAEGDIVFDGCVGEQLTAYGCVYQEAPDDQLEAPCETYCNASGTAMCQADFDLAGCVLFCQSIGTILPACLSPWQTLLECSDGAEFECNDSGDAQPVGCDLESVVFLACALPALSE